MDRVLTMDLGPRGFDSTVTLDGEDISEMLSGAKVTTTLKSGTSVELVPRPGQRVKLQAKVDAVRLTVTEPD